MSLTLYNTLTRSKVSFTPRDRNNVRMYVCGPTVYDFAHIGNARPIIVFDLLFRLLRHVYGEAHVIYARNITDVDDKINARAVERYPDMDPIAAIGKLTTETTAQFHADIAALGVLQPTVEPRATDHIEQMRALCEALVANGHAYVAENHVLFNVPSMADYGRLSGRSTDDMLAGARVDVAPYKRDPMDFVLWKPSEAGVPAWPSPCGIAVPGRPGWHLECSAMAGAHLGEVFDIHGGGIDLAFPHHENEIAQSRCAHGTSVMADVWMHNGFLQVEGEKMSKSLGNFVTINELLQKRMGEDIRWQMLKTHYRQPIDWTEHAGNVSKLDLIKFGRKFSRTTWQPVNPRHLDERFMAALCDDLNTPAAITVLHSLADEISSPTIDREGTAANTIDALHNGLVFLGFPEFATFEARRIAFHNRRAKISMQEVENLIAARIAARKARNFGEADRIRAELDGMGIQVMDAKNPATGEIETTWETKR